MSEKVTRDYALNWGHDMKAVLEFDLSDDETVAAHAVAANAENIHAFLADLAEHIEVVRRMRFPDIATGIFRDTLIFDLEALAKANNVDLELMSELKTWE